MRKKVLFVITKSNFGGAQRYVFDLATNLPQETYDVTVAFGHGARDSAGELSRMLVERDVRTLVIPELGRDMHLRNDWKSLWTLVAMFQNERPDVVHLNSSKAGGLGALAARIAGIKRIVFTIHGLPSDENRPRFQRTVIAFATWLTAMLAHRTIAISNEMHARLLRMPFLKSRCTLIYNGISPIDFVSKTEARKALRTIDPTIPESGTLVGTIAELHPNKDLATAIEALAHVPEAHFAIVGDGELREKLRIQTHERSIADRVHFLGFVPHAAIYARAFDVFLLTSIKEGLPYVLLEAGSAHVPILASDISGVREIVLHNFTGLLAAAGNPADVAEKLRTLLDDTSLARSLADEMTTRILSTFSLSRMIERTAALY